MSSTPEAIEAAVREAFLKTAMEDPEGRRLAAAAAALANTNPAYSRLDRMDGLR